MVRRRMISIDFLLNDREIDPRHLVGFTMNVPTDPAADPVPVGSLFRRVSEHGRSGAEYDTPPPSFVEAVSPVSSRKRGMLRAGSLGINPSAVNVERHSRPSTPMAGTSMGTGAHLSLAPFLTSVHNSNTAAVRTGGNNYPLPSLNQTQRPIINPFRDPANSRYSNVLPINAFGTAQFKSLLPKSQQALSGNPYIDRADEIGPQHGIPGVAHLGDFLPPRNWVEDQAPLDPQKVKELYEVSRKEAKDALSAEMGAIKDLRGQDLQKYEAERNSKWIVRLNLDKLIMKERLEIYEKYLQQNRQVGVMEGLANEAIVESRRARNSNGANPSFVVSRPSQTHVGGSQLSADESPSYVGGSMSYAGGSQASSADSMPLDPPLAKDTIRHTLTQYNVNRNRLREEARQNEDKLKTFLSEYGYHVVDGLCPPGNATLHDLPHLISSQGNGSLLRPGPYVSPTQVNFPRSGGLVQQTPRLPVVPGQPVSMMQPASGNPKVKIEPALLRQSFQQLQQLNPMRQVATNNSMQAPRGPVVANKKRTPAKTKAEKPKPWYQDHLDSSAMPVSKISEEAMRAGLEYGKTGMTAAKAAMQAAQTLQIISGGSGQANTTPSRRKGREPVDPAVGVTLSKEASKKLIAQMQAGNLPALRAVTTFPPRSAMNAVPSSRTYTTPYHAASGMQPANLDYQHRNDQRSGLPMTGLLGEIDKTNLVSVNNPQQIPQERSSSAIKPSMSTTPTKVAQGVAKKVLGRAQDEEYSDSSTDSDESTPSVDNDDPKDASFVTARGRGTGSAAKRTASAGVKRKATTPSTPAGKRARAPQAAQNAESVDDQGKNKSTAEAGSPAAKEH